MELQEYVGRLFPIVTSINTKISDSLAIDKELRDMQREIDDLRSQASVIEAEAAAEGIAIADLSAAAREALHASTVAVVHTETGDAGNA